MEDLSSDDHSDFHSTPKQFLTTDTLDTQNWHTACPLLLKASLESRPSLRLYILGQWRTVLFATY